MKTISEELKRGKFNKASQTYHNFFTNLTIRYNINTD